MSSFVFEFPPITEDQIGGVKTISPNGIPSAEALGSVTVLAPDFKLTVEHATFDVRQADNGGLGQAVWKTVCVTSDGTIHSIYRRPRSLEHAYSSDGGDTWIRQTVLMSAMTGTDEFYWDLDTDGAKLHLIYHEPGQPSLPGTTHVKRVETSGFTWQSPVVIEALISGSQRRVGVWVVETDRHYTYAYNRALPGADPANNRIRYSLNGAAPETVRSIVHATERVQDPAIVVGSDGTPFVFWYAIRNTAPFHDRYDFARKIGGSWESATTLASTTNAGDGFFYGGLGLMPLSVPLGSTGVLAVYDKSDALGTRGFVYRRLHLGSAFDGEGDPLPLPGDGIGGMVWPSLYSGANRIAYLGQISQHESVDRRVTAWSVFDTLRSQSEEHYCAADMGQSSVLSSASTFARAFRMTPTSKSAMPDHMIGTFTEIGAAGSKIWLLKIPKDY